MSAISDPAPTLKEHEMATVEVAFLLDIFATTIDDLMGGAIASVSRIAGRSMARKYPLDLNNPDMKDTWDAIAEQLKGGFDISCSVRNCSADLTIGKCAIRELCKSRNVELNGAICRLFHYYLDGVTNELYCRPVKSRITSTGDKCKAVMESK
jgi:hypothetical protein